MAKRVILPVLLATVSATLVWAGCKSDCKEEYTSEVESCHLLNDGPDDADDLKTCIEDAKNSYDSCIEECDS